MGSIDIGGEDVADFDDDGEITLERVADQVRKMDRTMRFKLLTHMDWQSAVEEDLKDLQKRIVAVQNALEFSTTLNRRIEKEVPADAAYRGNATMDLLKKVEVLEEKHNRLAESFAHHDSHWVYGTADEQVMHPPHSPGRLPILVAIGCGAAASVSAAIIIFGLLF
jgi:hypothetical protein